MDLIGVLQARIVAALPQIGSGLAIAAGFWLAATVARALLTRTGDRLGGERVDLLRLAAQLAFWLIAGFGIITGIGTMGVDIAALVAGLGLTGFALGFALRDAVANALSGVLILSYRPFHRGEVVEVDRWRGRVVQTNLRYTVMEGEGTTILVPNQKLFDNVVTVHRPPPPPEAPQGGV